MSDTGLLLDTCVWIEFLYKKDNPVKKKMIELINIYNCFLNQIIINEICYGAKNQEQFEKWFGYFSSILTLPINDQLMENVNRNRFILRKNGITTSLTDAIIATQAIDNKLPLYTIDQDFIHWRKIGLKLFN